MEHRPTQMRRKGNVSYPCLICVSSVAKRMPLRFLISLVLVFAAAHCAVAADSPIRVVADKDGKIIGFEATGNAAAGLEMLAPDDPSWAGMFAIYVGKKPGRPDVPPMLGSYAVHGTNIRFTPKFPLKPKLKCLRLHKRFIALFTQPLKINW